MFNAQYKTTIIATQPAIGDLRQEFNDNGMHRIVHSDGTATPFVPYRDFAYYCGYVSVTAFWADEGLYSAADFALMVATGVVATKQQAADFESGKGRVLMRDLADTYVVDTDDLADTPVAVSVANNPKDYKNKPVSHVVEDELDCEGCTLIVEDDVSGDADPELWEKAANMFAAAAKPVTRH